MEPDYIILLHIARLISKHPKKTEQFLKMWNITSWLTSDSGIWITFELYPDHTARAIITGTRSGMTITYNTWTDELTRKKRGAKPLYTTGGQCLCDDIQNIIDERFSNR